MTRTPPPLLDVIIPVFNEGENILSVLAALERDVRTPFRVLICYDFDEESTIEVVRRSWHGSLDLHFVKNRGRGVHEAVMSGFAASDTPYVITLPADDDYNISLLDRMVAEAETGKLVVSASRFIPGGSMVGCRPLKAFLVRAASYSLRFLAGFPSGDATNGFRLFSRQLLNRVAVESTMGFTYSLELMAKCHRLGWAVSEVPAQWMERTKGQSNFKLLQWLPEYLRWYRYAFATTYLRPGPESVASPAQPGPERPLIWSLSEARQSAKAGE